MAAGSSSSGGAEAGDVTSPDHQCTGETPVAGLSLTDAVRSVSLACGGGSSTDSLANSLNLLLPLLADSAADSQNAAGVTLSPATVKLLTSAVVLHVPLLPESQRAASAQLGRVFSVVSSALAGEARTALKLCAESPGTSSEDNWPVLTAFCAASQHALKRVRSAPSRKSASTVARCLRVLVSVVRELDEDASKLFFQREDCACVLSSALTLLDNALAPEVQADTCPAALGATDDLMRLEERQKQPCDTSAGTVSFLKVKAVRLLATLCDISSSAREILLQRVIYTQLPAAAAEGKPGPCVALYVFGRYLRRVLLCPGTSLRKKQGNSAGSPQSATTDEGLKKKQAAAKAEALQLREALLKVFVQTVLEGRHVVSTFLMASFNPLLSLIQEGDWPVVLPALQRGLKRSPTSALPAAISLFSSTSADCSSCFLPLLDEGLLSILKGAGLGGETLSRLEAALRIIRMLAEKCSDVAVLVQVILDRLYDPFKKGSLTKAGEKIAFLQAIAECLFSPQLKRRFPNSLHESWFSDIASPKSFFLSSFQSEVNEEVKIHVCRVIGLIFMVSLHLISTGSSADMASGGDNLQPFVSVLSKVILSLTVEKSGGKASGMASTTASPRLLTAALQALSVVAQSQQIGARNLGILREAVAPAASLLHLPSAKPGLRPQGMLAWVLVLLLEELRMNEEGSATMLGDEGGTNAFLPKNALTLIVEPESYINNLAAIEKAQLPEEMRSQVRMTALLCSRRPLVIERTPYGTPSLTSGEQSLLTDPATSSSGWLNLVNLSLFPPPSLANDIQMKSTSSVPALSGFHWGFVRLVMVTMQHRRNQAFSSLRHSQDCSTQALPSSSATSSAATTRAPSSSSLASSSKSDAAGLAAFSASASFFLSQVQRACQSVPELADRLLLAFYCQLGQFVAVETAGKNTEKSQPQASAKTTSAAPASTKKNAAAQLLLASQAPQMVAEKSTFVPCSAALRATLKFLLTLRYPREGTTPNRLADFSPSAGKSQTVKKGGGGAAQSKPKAAPQFNALFLLCAMHPLLGSSSLSSGSLLGSFLRMLTSSCIAGEPSGTICDAKGGKTRTRETRCYVSWDSLLNELLPRATEAPAEPEATGGYRAALFRLVEGIRGISSAERVHRGREDALNARSRKSGRRSKKAEKGDGETANADMTNGRSFLHRGTSGEETSNSTEAALVGLQGAAEAACGSLSRLLCTDELDSFSPKDVALYFAPDDRLYHEEGTYQAQEVEAKNVKKNKFQSALYGDLADEMKQPSKSQTAAPQRSGGGAQGRKDGHKKPGVGGKGSGASTASAGKGSSSSGGSSSAGGTPANLTKAQLEAEELREQQEKRRAMRKVVEQTTYGLECLACLGEALPSSIEPLFSVHAIEKNKHEAESKQGSSSPSEASKQDPQEMNQSCKVAQGLQHTFLQLMRSPLVSLKAVSALRQIVNGGVVSKDTVPKRSLLPDSLFRVAKGSPLEEAEVELLATIHQDAVLAPAAAALVLPVVSAILKNAQTAGLAASQQAMQLLQQQLQLRAPLHAKEVLGCLAVALRAHPSLVSTAALALQHFCSYLLTSEEKEKALGDQEREDESLFHELLNIAVAEEATIRQAVVAALRAAPKAVLKSHPECIAYLLVLQQDVAQGEADGKQTESVSTKLLGDIWGTKEVLRKERLAEIGILLRTQHPGFQDLAAKAYAYMVERLGGASEQRLVLDTLQQLFSWYVMEAFPEGTEKALAREEKRRRRLLQEKRSGPSGLNAEGPGAEHVVAYRKKEEEEPFFAVNGTGKKGKNSGGVSASGNSRGDLGDENSPGSKAGEGLVSLHPQTANGDKTRMDRGTEELEEETRRESTAMKLGVAKALQCLAEDDLLLWEDALQEVLRFLLTAGLTAPEAISNEQLQQALLAAGVSAIRHFTTEDEDSEQAVRQELFHVIEKTAKKGASLSPSMTDRSRADDKASSTRDQTTNGVVLKPQRASPAETQAVLNVACSVFFGAIAEKLDGSDPTVRNILKELVACIVDPHAPSPDVQRTVSRALAPLVRLCCSAASNGSNAAAGGAEDGGGGKEDNQAFCVSLLGQMLEAALTGDDVVIRRGGARGLGGIVKGLGIASLKNQGVMDTLKAAMESKDGVRRQGALLCIEALSDSLGRLFEPYTLSTLSLLLSSFSDTAFPVRLAAQEAAKQLMTQLSGHGVKLVLPTLIEKLHDPQWRTKVGSIELLGAMTHCAPRQLASCLPQVVPLLSEVMSDTCFPKVRESARDALFAIAEVISNPEIKQLAPQLIETLVDPTTEHTKRMLEILLATSFRNSVDAPSLALVCPIAIRGLRERGSETKHKAANIVGSMVYLATEPKDFLPYLPQVLTHLQATLVDPIPHVRAAAARTFGTIAKGVGEEHLADVLSWLFKTLKTSESSVERSGAAFGLSEVLVALGPARLKAFLPDILTNATDQQAPADVREGYLGLFVYLPTAFKESFQDYVPEVLPVLLGGLADDSEPVRDVSLRACDVCVQQYAQTHTALLLRPLEDGLFSPDWRIRQSSVTLIGTLLERLLRGCDEGTVAAEDVMHTEILSLERRAFILSSLYIVRSDEAAAVRQTAVQVWKSLVSNSPRTLKELLPILTKRLISNLAASTNVARGEEKQRVAARCIGSLAHKLGDAVLPQLLPCLAQSLKSPDASTRRGVCIGLAEVVASAPRALLSEHLAALLSIVRTALGDQDASVQHSASRAAAALIEGMGSDATDRILPPMLSQLVQPPVFNEQKAKEVFTPLRDAQMQGFELLLQQQVQAVLPRLLAEVSESRPLDASKLRLLGACAAAVHPLDNRMQRNLKRIFQLILGVCSQSAELPQDADPNMLWTEALMAALRIIKRLDVEGVASLLAVLEEDLRASSPLIDLTAHGRQQLLNRSSGGGTGRQQQGCGAGGGASVPILPSAFLDVAELRAHPNFLKFVETSPDLGRRRRMAGEIILLILWSRSINGALPVLKHILQLVLPLALIDPSEEALVAGGACLAAVNAQIRREDLLGFIPDIHGTVLKFLADPVTGKPVGSDVLILPGLSISKKEPPTFVLSCKPLPPPFPPFSPSLLNTDPPSPAPVAFETLALIYQQGLMYGSVTIREASSRALQQLVLHARASAVEPMTVKLAGPLIRTVGDKFGGQVKTAILLALKALLLKAGPSLKPLLPQLQTTLLKCILEPHPTVRSLGCRILGDVTALNVTSRVEGLLGELVNLSQNAAATGAGALQVSLLQALSRVLKSLSGRCSPATYEKILTAGWDAMRSRQEEDAKIAAGQALAVLLLKHAGKEDALTFVREQVIESGRAFEVDSRVAACMVLAPLLRVDRGGWEILKGSDIEEETFELVGTLLEDQAGAVQRAAVELFRVAATNSRLDSVAAKHCFRVVPRLKSCLSAGGAASTATLVTGLRGLRSLAKHSPTLLGDRSERFLVDTCDLACAYLFHQSPVVKLQAEAVLRYAFRVSGSDDGSDEAAIAAGLQHLQAGGFPPRSLQQLSEYSRRVLTRTAQSTNQLSDTEDDDEADSAEHKGDWEMIA